MHRLVQIIKLTNYSTVWKKCEDASLLGWEDGFCKNASFIAFSKRSFHFLFLSFFFYFFNFGQRLLIVNRTCIYHCINLRTWLLNICVALGEFSTISCTRVAYIEANNVRRWLNVRRNRWSSPTFTTSGPRCPGNVRTWVGTKRPTV